VKSLVFEGDIDILGGPKPPSPPHNICAYG